jgi:hypothetical protein
MGPESLRSIRVIFDSSSLSGAKISCYGRGLAEDYCYKYLFNLSNLFPSAIMKERTPETTPAVTATTPIPAMRNVAVLRHPSVQRTPLPSRGGTSRAVY